MIEDGCDKLPWQQELKILMVEFGNFNQGRNCLGAI